MNNLGIYDIEVVYGVCYQVSLNIVKEKNGDCKIIHYHDLTSEAIIGLSCLSFGEYLENRSQNNI